MMNRFKTLLPWLDKDFKNPKFRSPLCLPIGLSYLVKNLRFVRSNAWGKPDISKTDRGSPTTPSTTTQGGWGLNPPVAGLAPPLHQMGKCINSPFPFSHPSLLLQHRPLAVPSPKPLIFNAVDYSTPLEYTCLNMQRLPYLPKINDCCARLYWLLFIVFTVYGYFRMQCINLSRRSVLNFRSLQ